MPVRSKFHDAAQELSAFLGSSKHAILSDTLPDRWHLHLVDVIGWHLRVQYSALWRG